jgi:hypothetical protein
VGLSDLPNPSVFLSLSLLLRRVSPLGTWGKNSKPSTDVKAGIPRNGGLVRGLYQTANATWVELKTQCTKTFFLSTLSSLSSLNSLPFRSDPLRRRSENEWEGKFLFKLQGCSGWGNSPVGPEG